MSDMDATALGLLAEPNRLRILRLIWSQERAAGEIAREFQTTFGAVSQHLARLRDAGFVRVRRKGRRRLYRADRVALRPMAEVLERMWREQLNVLKTLAEAEQARRDAEAGTSRRPMRTSAPHAGRAKSKSGD